MCVNELSSCILIKVLTEFSGYAGSKDHIKVQGEILEGLVARVVSPDSSKHMENVLREYHPPPAEGGIVL